MALSDIKQEHVLDALTRFDAGEFDPRSVARKYAIRHDGKQYPPKWILSLAHESATGTRLAVATFNGGVQANSVLTSLGFEVVPFAKDAAWRPPSESSKTSGRTKGSTSVTPVLKTEPASKEKSVEAARAPVSRPNGLWSLRIGLVLHKPTSARRRRLRDALADGQAKGLDLLLFPETYEEYTGLRQEQELVGAYRSLAKVNRLAIAVGVLGPVVSEGAAGQQLWLFPADGAKPLRYIKHTTSGFSALDLDEYALHAQLPVTDVAGVKVGMTLCHDHYIAPLQESLVRRGAQVLLNPSDNTNKSHWRKWTVVQRARAVENRVYSFCTVRKADSDFPHLWAVAPNGEDVLLAQWGSNEPPLAANEVRIDGGDKKGLPIWWAEIGPGGASASAPGIPALWTFQGDYMAPNVDVSVNERGLTLGSSRIAKTTEIADVTAAKGLTVRVVRMESDVLMTATRAWKAVHAAFELDDVERALLWLPLQSAPDSALLTVAASRALELCVPVILTHAQRLWVFAFVGGAKLIAGENGVASAEIPFAVSIQGRGFARTGSSLYALEPISIGTTAKIGRERIAKFLDVFNTLP